MKWQFLTLSSCLLLIILSLLSNNFFLLDLTYLGKYLVVSHQGRIHKKHFCRNLRQFGLNLWKFSNLWSKFVHNYKSVIYRSVKVYGTSSWFCLVLYLKSLSYLTLSNLALATVHNTLPHLVYVIQIRMGISSQLSWQHTMKKPKRSFKGTFKIAS